LASFLLSPLTSMVMVFVVSPAASAPAYLRVPSLLPSILLTVPAGSVSASPPAAFATHLCFP
jgi:hypothetical protein